MKVKKTYSSFQEHYLVPTVLFLLNVCIAHFVYAITSSSYSTADKIVVALSFVLFGASLLFKGKKLLSGSILFYILIVVYLIMI